MKPILRTTLALALTVLVACVLGMGSAWWAMARVPTSVRNGPWQHDALMGGVAAGPYVRAQVVRHAPLALNHTEAIYLIAETDSDGNALRCDEVYRIEGRDLDARWWSVTCYGPAGFFVPNPQNRYSYNMTNLARNDDGTYTIHLSREEKPGNWLPTGDAGRFSLILRLYNPEPSVREHLGTIDLPRIVREDRSHE